MAEEDQLVNLLVKSFFTPKILEEKITTLEGHFEGLDIRSIPEYQTLADALKNYGDAVSVKYLEARGKKKGVN